MEMGEMFGWMQQFLVTLGIWDTLSTAISIVVILGTTITVINLARGR